MKKNIHIEPKTTYNGQQMKDTNSYVEHKPSYTVNKIAKEDELKGSELKSFVLTTQMKNIGCLGIETKDYKEYSTLLNALNINKEKII